MLNSTHTALQIQALHVCIHILMTGISALPHHQRICPRKNYRRRWEYVRILIVITKRCNLLVNMQVMFYMSQAVTSMYIACSAGMHRVTSRIKIKYIIFAWINIDHANDYVLKDDLSGYIVEYTRVELNAPSIMHIAVSSKITRHTDITGMLMSKLATMFKRTKSVCILRICGWNCYRYCLNQGWF